MINIFSPSVSPSYIIGRLFYPVWLCFGLFLFVFSLSRKKHFLWKTLLFVLSVFLCSFLIPVNTPFIPFNAIGILLCVILYLRFGFYLNSKTSIFYGVSVALLQNLSWNLSIALQLTFIKDEITGVVSSFPLLRWDTGLIFVFSSLFTYGLCFLFFIRPLKEFSQSGIKNYKLVLYSILILIVIYIIADALNSYKIENKAILRYILTIACFGLFGSLYSTSMADKLQLEKKIMDSLFEKEQKDYENLSTNITTMNKRAHDLKYQLLAMEKESEFNKNAIQELKNSLSVYERSPKTGNIALDNTLHEKMILCESKDILFIYRIDGKALSFMEAIDIYVLFGNALDNAIECVSKYKEKERRTITMNSFKTGNLLKFHLENPCFEEISFEKNMPLTSKKEAFFHGYGTKSMKEIVKKYHGQICFERKGDCFFVDMLFVLKEQNSLTD